jgi:outer membrane biosynthesis protein TonB
MEILTTAEQEERIAALEKRVRDMEALVRGLTSELLDLKTVAMAMSRQDKERSRQELKKGIIVQETLSPEPAVQPESPTTPAPAEEKIVIRPKSAQKQEEPAASPEANMVRIMQSDGTFKLEPRRGNRKMI